MTAPCFVGVDVSQGHLDVHLRPQAEAFRVTNDPEGIAANSITLEYSVDGGSSWLPVASGLADSGTYDWTVPGTPSTSTRVRASAECSSRSRRRAPDRQSSCVSCRYEAAGRQRL